MRSINVIVSVPDGMTDDAVLDRMNAAGLRRADHTPLTLARAASGANTVHLTAAPEGQMSEARRRELLSLSSMGADALDAERARA